ncbi:MAG: hypothetical protein M1616_06555 [Candidatus Thermoplasmatota archaeon]|jgi:hypothetical protein|nr:hypothetical protein [Candidatus Thermoplasmatota archaeon]
MNYICPKCRGSGYIKDESDHLDICDSCWGLGYVEEIKAEQKFSASPEEKRIRRNALIVLAISVSVFYAILFLLSPFIKYTSIEMVILILASYYSGIIGSSLYVRHAMKKINSGGGRRDLPGQH